MHKFIDIKRHHKILTIYLLLILTIIVTYWQVENFDFVNFDDPVYVTANPKVQSGLTIDGITWAFTTFCAGNWHPLTWLSHMLDCELYGLNPMGHHWTSLQIHLTNTLLLFFYPSVYDRSALAKRFCGSAFCLTPSSCRIGCMGG